MTAPQPEALLRLAVACTLALLAVSALSYVALGLDLMDHLHLFPSCPFRSLTGIPCPGCGMTRALVLLSQLRIASSVAAHPAAPAMLALMLAYLLRPKALRQREALAAFGLIAVIGLWLARGLQS